MVRTLVRLSHDNRPEPTPAPGDPYPACAKTDTLPAFVRFSPWPEALVGVDGGVRERAGEGREAEGAGGGAPQAGAGACG
ncbi:hypothetical protein GCM10009602_60900 [Nocardiopsis tropica]